VKPITERQHAAIKPAPQHNNRNRVCEEEASCPRCQVSAITTQTNILCASCL